MHVVPLYYGYKIIFAAVVADTAFLIEIGKLIGYILLFAFYLPFTLQSLLAAGLDRKKLDVPFKKLWPAILLSPVFMIIYAISICLGVFSRPKWKKIKRNVVSADAAPTEEILSEPAAEIAPSETADEQKEE